jgi:trimethylamine---corrinoid protein Co-methyltransferase
MVELAQRPAGEGTLATTAALAESMGALMRPSLNILGDELTGRIVDEAKRVLAEVGMEIRGPEMRRRLVEHGLPTNATGERVLFPRDVVEAAIASAPSSFTLFDRDGLPHADLGGDRVHFVPGSSGLKVLDHRTGETRLANSTDFVEYVRLADGLEHIAYLATAFSTNLDIEAQVSDAWRLYMTLTNSKKPVVSGAFTEHGVPRMVEMMQLFRADRADLIARPMSIFTITATGNFRYSEDSCQNMIDCVEAGIPVEIVPVTLMGLIAPVTIVGATVFHTVDVLAGITMAQVIKPGAPVLFGGAPATFHMKIASAPMAAIEALRLDVAYIAVAKALGLPCQSYMALSDGKILDAQAGAETFGSALLAALAGVNSVSGPGMLDFLLVFSLPKLVFDDEMCAQALQFVREVQPAEDLPVSALIDQLMADQHLIMAEHTMAHWPSELYLPSTIVDRDNREAWLRLGGKDTYQRACDEVERRLASYRQPATDPAIDAELRSIIKAGLSGQTVLPEIPPAPEPAEVAPSGAAARRQNPRRQRISQEGPPT